MACYYKFLRCKGRLNCEHSEVELDGLDREEMANEQDHGRK